MPVLLHDAKYISLTRFSPMMEVHGTIVPNPESRALLMDFCPSFLERSSDGIQ